MLRFFRETDGNFCREPYLADFFPYITDDIPYITDDIPYITDI